MANRTTLKMAIELQFKRKRPMGWFKMVQPDTGRHQDEGQGLATKTVGK